MTITNTKYMYSILSIVKGVHCSCREPFCSIYSSSPLGGKGRKRTEMNTGSQSK